MKEGMTELNTEDVHERLLNICGMTEEEMDVYIFHNANRSVTNLMSTESLHKNRET